MSKKIFTFLFAVALAFSMGIPAFADSSENSSNGITITYGDNESSEESSNDSLPSSQTSEPEAPSEGTSLPSTIRSTMQYLPIEINESEKDGVFYVEKVYEIPSDVSPNSLIEPFTLGDVSYEFFHITQTKSQSETTTTPETKLASKTITVDCTSKEMSEILKLLDPLIDYEDEEGFTGQLRLDASTIYTEAGGQSTQKKSVSEKVEYTGLERNDPYLIKKTIQKYGATLQLTDITWKATAFDGTMPTEYKAICIYVGTVYATSTSGYTATGTYVGEVTRLQGRNDEFLQVKITYKAKANAAAETDSKTPPGPTVSGGKQSRDFPLIPVIGLSAFLFAMIGLCIVLKKKGMKFKLPGLNKKKQEKTKIYMHSSMRPTTDEDFMDNMEAPDHFDETDEDWPHGNTSDQSDEIEEMRRETDRSMGFAFDPNEFLDEEGETYE